MYWEWPGGDPPVLLLHGVGNYGRYWDLVAREVAGRYRLIAPDARGHGDSSPVEDAQAREFVDDALAILDDARIDRAVVVGHSMGGSHAFALVAAHPDRVRALVVVDNSPEPLPEGSERAYRLTHARTERFASRDEALAYLRRTSPGYTDEVYENRLRWAFRPDGDGLRWRSDPASLRRIFGGGGARDRWGELRSVRVPATIVRGTRSNVLSREVAERMRDAMAGASLIEVDAGHNPALEQPRAVADAIADVVSRSA